MASNKALEERVKTLVAEMLAEEEGEGQLDNTIEIEDAMVRIGDLVAREFGVQALAAQTRPLSEYPCGPECGHAGEHVGKRARELITRRGSQLCGCGRSLEGTGRVAPASQACVASRETDRRRKKETGTPRAQVASSWEYLTNQRQRTNYNEYRQQGLPITSSPIESTIKQINRRLKGTE